MFSVYLCVSVFSFATRVWWNKMNMKNSRSLREMSPLSKTSPRYCIDVWQRRQTRVSYVAASTPRCRLPWDIASTSCWSASPSRSSWWYVVTDRSRPVADRRLTARRRPGSATTRDRHARYGRRPYASRPRPSSSSEACSADRRRPVPTSWNLERLFYSGSGWFWQKLRDDARDDADSLQP